VFNKLGEPTHSAPPSTSEPLALPPSLCACVAACTSLEGDCNSPSTSVPSPPNRHSDSDPIHLPPTSPLRAAAGRHSIFAFVLSALLEFPRPFKPRLCPMVSIVFNIWPACAGPVPAACLSFTTWRFSQEVRSFTDLAFLTCKPVRQPSPSSAVGTRDLSSRRRNNPPLQQPPLHFQ
jgi:hypothetical protein